MRKEYELKLGKKKDHPKPATVNVPVEKINEWFVGLDNLINTEVVYNEDQLVMANSTNKLVSHSTVTIG
jgi:hypothetical protein